MIMDDGLQSARFVSGKDEAGPPMAAAMKPSVLEEQAARTSSPIPPCSAQIRSTIASRPKIF